MCGLETFLTLHFSVFVNFVGSVMFSFLKCSLIRAWLVLCNFNGSSISSLLLNSRFSGWLVLQLLFVGLVFIYFSGSDEGSLCLCRWIYRRVTFVTCVLLNFIGLLGRPWGRCLRRAWTCFWCVRSFFPLIFNFCLLFSFGLHYWVVGFSVFGASISFVDTRFLRRCVHGQIVL